MRIGVVVFPGSNCDRDSARALERAGAHVLMLWHQDATLPLNLDAVILPGGFSYGDHLRAGAMGSVSPIMAGVRRFARAGGPVLGVCNGFQILLEAKLLPGAMLPNHSTRFVCRDATVRATTSRGPWMRGFEAGQVASFPVAHGRGQYTIDEQGLDALWAHEQVLWQYCDPQGQLTPESNPNGSLAHIAGICNAQGNVVGMMPHPERASFEHLGRTDGRAMWSGLAQALEHVLIPGGHP